MRVVRAGTGPLHLAPVSARPMAQVLMGEDAGGGQLAATQVVIPARAGMSERDHGDSAALVVPLAGELVICSGSQQEKVTPGTVVLLDRGERVQLTNPTGEPVTLIAVFAARSESANAGRGTSSRAQTPAPIGNSQWVAAGPLDQVEDDTAVHLDLAGHAACLARSRGSVHALLDECSHGQVALSDGDVENGHVECWLHGSRFDLTTGAPTGLPATRPVPVYPVRITDGGIEVALPARSGDAAHG
jgi:3-phenylpropionate/trans-cinnamate dioxygenase ferredoxin subunit